MGGFNRNQFFLVVARTLSSAEVGIKSLEVRELLLLLGALGLLLGGDAFLGFLLLGEEDSVDVGQDTSLGDGDAAEELVELFVVADGQLQVTGDDAGALVVAGGVAG